MSAPPSTRLSPHAGDVVIVTHEIPTEAAREALRIGRDGGAWTVLNPAPADGIDRTMLSLADVVTPNRGELARLAAADARRSGRPTPAARTRSGPRRRCSRRRPRARAPAARSSSRSGRPGRCSCRVTVRRSTSPRRRSSRWTRRAPATRSTGRSPRASRAASTWSRRRGARSSRRRLSVTRAGAREGMPTRAELEAGARGDGGRGRRLIDGSAAERGHHPVDVPAHEPLVRVLRRVARRCRCTGLTRRSRPSPRRSCRRCPG